MSAFGSDFHKIWPKPGYSLKISDFGRNLLLKCVKVEKPNPNKTDINEFINKSNKFPLEFAVNSCRVQNQPKDRLPIIQEQIGSAYPVIHELTLGLYLAFLEHKSKYGNRQERKIYSNLTLTDFVQRLLSKRCASFYNVSDKYLLLTGERGYGGFMEVGTDNEKLPLTLENVLSYDEVKVSALLSVSSHSEFINDGNRRNAGFIEKNKSKIERDGVVIGIIGARLCQRNVMEFQDIIISKTQNTKQNGYGEAVENNVNTPSSDYRRIWKEFYEERDFRYTDVSKNGQRFGSCFLSEDVFDNLLMKKRYAISFDTLLLESEAKAARANKSAYIHVVGIGLGVWRVAEQQEKIFLETFTERLNVLVERLPHIAVVHFSWFQLTQWGELKNRGVIASKAHPKGGITTYLSNRNPADKLPYEHKDKLLIVSYAWDGGSLPGNEYWMKHVKSSGDSSTACSTLVTELHNPHINTEMVNGNNLHIATEMYGVLHIADYAKHFLNLL